MESTGKTVGKRIAIVHPSFTLGGASAVAVFALEGLVNENDVTLFTTQPVDVSAINAFYGTTLQADHFTNIASVKHAWLQHILQKAFYLEVHWMQRFFKKHYQQTFDTILATRCEMDLGETAIQYIHFPVVNDEPLRELGQMPKGILFNKGIVRNLYRWLCERVSRFRYAAMLTNKTITNSQWTADIIKAVYNINATVVSPPVPNDFPRVAWQDKEPAFVTIGKLSPIKGTDEMIDIIAEVHKRFPDVTMHLLGRARDDAYARHIRSRVQMYDWLTWHEDKDRTHITNRVSKSRYGIHGMQNEHFGIVVAEMIQAGCIPFVPANGGQAEVVANAMLHYASKQEAIERICDILALDPDRQESLQQDLQHSTHFTVQTFQDRVKAIVK